jgi:hypothetical protein
MPPLGMGSWLTVDTSIVQALKGAGIDMALRVRRMLGMM